MKDVWNKNPAAWKKLPLVDRLEAMRHWHCTGPCGQSASVMGTRTTLNATILEAERKITLLSQRKDELRTELLAALIESSDYAELYKRAMELVERYKHGDNRQPHQPN